MWREPSTIPPRDFLYDRHLIRKFVSATIAPGGTGKSTRAIADAIALASSINILQSKPHASLNVWYWNGEDPLEEIERRIAAALIFHNIDASAVQGRLWVDSGRDTPIKISAETAVGNLIAVPVLDALVAAIVERNIDVLIIDPFISVHELPENDNKAMDAAVKAFGAVADRGNCAIELIHHSRKLNGGEADIDAARGGSAMAAAFRSAQTLNVMNGETAKAFGIDEAERRSYVRIDNAKANLSPPGKARWFKLAAQALGNANGDRFGDIVAVAQSWQAPDLLQGLTLDDLIAVQRAIEGQSFRENPQSHNWVGHKVASVVGLNIHNERDKQKIKVAIRAWLASGALVTRQVHDPRTGRDVKVVDVGETIPSTLHKPGVE